MKFVLWVALLMILRVADASVILIQRFPDRVASAGDTLKIALEQHLFINLRDDEDLLFKVHGFEDWASPITLEISGGGSRLLVFGSQRWYSGSQEIRIMKVDSTTGPDGFLLDRFVVDFRLVPGKTPPLFRGFQTGLQEDTPLWVNLNSHYVNFEGRGPLRFEIPVSDTNASYQIVDSILQIVPRKDHAGWLDFSLKATDTASSSSWDDVLLSVTAVNDTPRVSVPFTPVRTGYFDSIVIMPDVHFHDPENGAGRNLDVSLSWDETLFRGENRSRTYVLKSLRKPASGMALARATDWALPRLTRETSFSLFNNDPNRQGIRFNVPVSYSAGSYPTLPDIRWLNAQQTALAVRIADTTILIDQSRRLIANPFIQTPGSCIVAQSAGKKLMVLGKSGFPATGNSVADDPVEGYWNYSRHVFPSTYSDSPSSCASEDVANGVRFARWNSAEVAGRVWTGTLDSNGQFSGEMLRQYGTSRISDVLVLGSKTLVLFHQNVTTGGEREVLWMDVLDSALNRLQDSIRISVYDAPASSAHANFIPFGKLIATATTVEVVWGKIDSDNNGAEVPAGSKIFRKTFDAGDFSLKGFNDLQVGNAFASTLRLAGVDRRSADDIRVYWSNLFGSCLDQSVGSVRINPLHPDSVYQDTVAMIRPNACGGGVTPFRMAYHFGDGSSFVYHGANLPNRYIEFLPPGGVVSVARPAEASMRRKNVTRLSVQRGRITVDTPKGRFDPAGRKRFHDASLAPETTRKE